MISLPDPISIRASRVLIIGDAMVDEYWHAHVSRISPEAPIPVAHIQHKTPVPGGAANTAANAARLGSHTTLITVVGADPQGELLTQLVTKHGIHAYCVPVDGYTTNTKIRILGGGNQQQLVRLDFEKPVPEAAYPLLESHFLSLLDSHDVVVFSDYHKGALAPIASWIAHARARQKIVLVDPKGSDWSRYHGATMITPNCQEMAQVIGPWTDEDALQTAITQLIGRYQWEGLLLTRSEAGMTWFQPGIRHHIPTRAQEVFDVSGAGDTAMATLAVMRAAGYDWLYAIQIANIAAGIAVSKHGTSTVSWAELRQALSPPVAPQGVHTHTKIWTEAICMEQMAALKHKGQRIVMTNGCFDLLHPGHIHYLEIARDMGDFLVVAINTDASVQRLKGPQRPVHDLNTRMRMLAALHCVDAVVAFDESTPERLITAIQPHILVKGGDYTVEQIAGAPAVIRSGGKVQILPFVDGYSTTRTIQKIRGEDL